MNDEYPEIDTEQLLQFRDKPIEAQKVATFRARLLEIVMLEGFKGVQIGSKTFSPFGNPPEESLRHFATVSEAAMEYIDELAPLIAGLKYFSEDDLYTIFSLSLRQIGHIVWDAIRENRKNRGTK